MATNRDLSHLMLDAYQPRGERQGYADGGFAPYGNGVDLPNGLRIQAYVNESTREIVIGIAGTDQIRDGKAYPSYATGSYHDQFREAVEYAHEVTGSIAADRPDADQFSFFVTGHSQGGGIAQVLADAFGWGGMTAEAPGAAAIIKSQEYRAHLTELGIHAEGAGNLINYTEQGSWVTDLLSLDYVGQRLELNLTPDIGTLIGSTMLLAAPSALLPVGIASIISDQWGGDGQHKVAKFAEYLSTIQDPNVIKGWTYVEGGEAGWVRKIPNVDTGEYEITQRAAPEIASLFDLERARRQAVNEQVKESSGERGDVLPPSMKQGINEAFLNPLLENGGLNPEFVAAFNNPSTVAEFLQDHSGLQLADAGDAIQREYAAYVYNKALAQAAAMIGQDVARILQLDVPGNPNAPSGYLDAKGFSHAVKDFAGTLGMDPRELVSMLRDGALDAHMDDLQLGNLQSRGIQTLGNGLGEALQGLRTSNVLTVATGLVQLGLGADQLLDTIDADAGFFEETGTTRLHVGGSAARLIGDVLGGDELGGVASGIRFLEDLGAAGVEGLEGIGSATGVRGSLGGLSLYQALDGGGAASIANAGYTSIETLSDQAVSNALNQVFDVSPGKIVPYASYITAGINLLEGDVEQAGMSALSGYLMATGNPVGVAAGVALTLLGGSLFGSQAPNAWADFVVNADGSVDVSVNANDAGAGLEDAVAQTAAFLTPVITNLRSFGVEVQQGYLPRVGIRDDEYYIEDHGGKRLVLDPREGLARLVEAGVIGHWMLNNDVDTWSRSGRHVHLGATDWSGSVRGTGVFAGGGQARHAPIRIDSQALRSLGAPVSQPLARELEAVARTWRADKSLFAGEGGALLALGLGAGLVSFAEVAATAEVANSPVSVLQAAGIAALIGDAGEGSVIVSGHGPLGGDPPGASLAGDTLPEMSIAMAPFYHPERLATYDDPLTGFAIGPGDPGNSAPHTAVPMGATPTFTAAGEPADQAQGQRPVYLPAADGNGTGGAGQAPDPAETAGGAARGDSRTAALADPGAAPVPGADALSMVEDRFLLAAPDELVANDGDRAAFLGVGTARHGHVTLDAAGMIRFTPPPDFAGRTGFSYQSRTADGGVQTRQVEVTVDARNDRPDAVPDDYAGEQGTPLLLNRLLANDMDIDGEPLRIAAVSQVSVGRVDVDAGGNFRYIPPADYRGDVQLVYLAEDPAGMRAASRATLTITPGANDPPLVESVLLEGGLEERPFRFHESELLAAARDPEGGTLSIQSLAALRGGSLDWDRDSGEVVFTPNQDFHGLAGVRFTVADPEGLQRDATAQIVFENVVDPFTSGDTGRAVDQNEVVLFKPESLLSGLTVDNPDGGELSIVAARMAAGMPGWVNHLPDGSVQWVPPPGYTGPSAFELRVSNGHQRAVSRVDLEVRAVSEPPPGPDIRGPAALDGLLSAAAIAPAAGDMAPGGAVPVPAPRAPHESPSTVSAGAVTLTDMALLDPAGGAHVFSPATDSLGEAGLPHTLTRTASADSGTGGATPAVGGVDHVLVVDDRDLRHAAFNLDEDAAHVFTRAELLGGATDADRAILSIHDPRLLDPGHGQVSLSADGGVRFTPVADHHGAAPFEIEVSDGRTTVTATMTPYLWPVNDAPHPTSDSVMMDEGARLALEGVSLLANDQDVEDGPAGLRLVGVWQTSSGAARYDAAGDILHYTPPEDAFGDAWLDYLVEDRDGAFSTARLHVTINNVDDPPRAVADTLLAMEDQDRVFDAALLTGNDANPDRELLRIVALDDSGISHGRVSLTPDGDVAYYTQADYWGEQTFAYTVEDDSGNRSSAAVHLQVQPVNDTPRVMPGAALMLEDDTLAVPLSELAANATDIEDDWLQVVGARAQHGVVEFDAFDRQVRFTPDADLNSHLNGGPLALEYLVRDENGAETWARMAVDVSPVNDAPLATDDLLLAWEAGPGGYVNVVAASDLLANDTDIDGEVLRIDQVAASSGTSVRLDGDTERIEYTAAPGFTGQDRFTYRVTDDVLEGDGTLSADTAAVIVQVLDNRAPLAHDFATLAAEDTVLRFDREDFLAHVDDPDLGYLELPELHRIVAVRNASHGAVALNDDGSASFTPDPDFNSVQHHGVAGFDYVVEDIVGNRAEGHAAITYTPVNDAPVAVDERVDQRVLEEQVAFFAIDDLLANDYDVDGQTLRFDGLAGDAAHGTVTVQGDQIRYLGDRDFFGSDSFHYRVTDDAGGHDTAAVRLTVSNVNDRPRVEFDSARADDSGANTIGGLLNNDFDADGDRLRIINPSQGQVVNGGTAIRFNADNRGHDYHTTITYGVTDGQATVQSRLDVDVLHVNRPPSGLIRIQTDIDSVFVAGIDPDTPDPVERYLGGTLSFAGYAWGADVHQAPGPGAGHNGLFIDVKNQHGHTVSLPDPNQAVLHGNGTFRYTVAVDDGDNVRNFGGSISLPVTLHNSNFSGGRPVVLDLDDDGLELGGPGQGAAFDWDNDGRREASGWITGEGDALLAYDHDGDRLVTRADEISFTGYLDGATTDLEGLRAFDSNRDGWLDSGDAQWSRFGLWRDDGDAVSQAGELIPIEDSKVESLALYSDQQAFELNGNTVYGLAEVGFRDGTRGELGDVAFAIGPEVGESIADAFIPDEPGTDALALQDGPEDVAGGPVDSAAATAGTGGPDDPDTDAAIMSNMQRGRADAVSSTPSDSVSHADELALPSDEELDRMARADNARAASQAPEEPVAAVEVDAALNDPPAVPEDSDGIDVAA